MDWLLALPDELSRRFEHELAEFDEEHQMPYITSIERHGMEQGLQQGLQAEARLALLEALVIRLGKVPISL